jgi:Zn-dependent protease
MKIKPLRLFKIKGIPIGLDPSWFLIFALITWSLAVSYFPHEFKQWSRLLFWSVAVVTSLLFFTSVFLHELGHSLVAMRYKLGVKSITLYIFGGISEIASEPRMPWKSLLSPLQDHSPVSFWLPCSTS